MKINLRLIKRGKILICPFFVFLVMLLMACSETKTTLPVSVTKNLRAPAYPLITIDPYTSAWSEADHLYDDAIRHWTGKRVGLIGALRVDGQVYRFMGKEEIPRTAILPMADQGAWEGKYGFQIAGSPALPGLFT